jgi:hypothetical protein
MTTTIRKTQLVVDQWSGICFKCGHVRAEQAEHGDPARAFRRVSTAVQVGILRRLDGRGDDMDRSTLGLPTRLAVLAPLNSQDASRKAPISGGLRRMSPL